MLQVSKPACSEEWQSGTNRRWVVDLGPERVQSSMHNHPKKAQCHVAVDIIAIDLREGSVKASTEKPTTGIIPACCSLFVSESHHERLIAFVEKKSATEVEEDDEKNRRKSRRERKEED